MRRALLVVVVAALAACAGSPRDDKDLAPPADAVVDAPEDGDAAQVADVADTSQPEIISDVDPDGPPDVSEPPPRPFSVVDAGDAAWVTRATLALLGRRPAGIREVRALVDLVTATDRETVARVLMTQPQFEDRWIEWFIDDLRINRVGHKEHAKCFGQSALATSEELLALAQHIRESAPEEAGFGSPFTMRDALRASLRADDVSVMLRSFLFPMQSRPLLYCANLPPETMERSRRKELASRFSALYMQRTVSCLPCHNSQASVTDDEDPAVDRFWPVPGRFEEGLFGNSGGRSEEDLAAFFRSRGVISATALASAEERKIWPPDHAAPVRPWGMSADCSELYLPGALEPDPYERPAWLIEEPAGVASIWNIERHLRDGIEGLRAQGTLAFSPSEVWPGTWSLAYQTAQRLAQSVWQEVHGSPLTVGHHFPRNEQQRDTLWGLTNTLVESDWSLQALLLAVVTDPLFNPVAPDASTLDEPWDPYTLPPVFDPWTRAAADPEQRNNSPGDMINRPSGHVMISMAGSALGWPTPTGFPTTYEVGQYLYAAGVYLSDTEPGFRGVGFQDRLTWEAVAGQCRPLPEFVPPGCTSADCYVWSPDWIDALALAANAPLAAGGADATVRDVVVALKDRLVTEPDLAPGEAELLAGLYEVPSLDTPLADAPGWEAKARAHCSVLLNTPQFMLTGLAAAPQSDAPRLVVGAGGYADYCDALRAGTLAVSGRTLTCGQDDLSVTP